VRKEKTRDFYKKLIDETFVDCKINDTILSHDELSEYFIKMTEKMKLDGQGTLEELIDIYASSGTTIFKGSYIKNTRCFRLNIPGGFLDFPENWDLFSEVSLISNDLQLIFVDIEADKRMLREVLGPFASYQSDLLFLFNKQDFQLIFVPAGNRTIYSGLSSFLSPNIKIAS
jgi:hypothetical protein